MLTWVPWLWTWGYEEPELPPPEVIPPFPPPVVHPPGYIDRVRWGLARVIQQYTESPKFLAWLVALLSLEADTEDCLQNMKLQTDIDKAEGVNLYIIAAIVGAPIVYTNELISDFIAWKDQTAGFPFWDAADPTITGGRWREEGELETTIVDLWEAQRLVIRATILRNHSSGSGDSIQRGLMFLFPNVSCIVYDEKDMSFSIGIGRYLSDVERQLISLYDILPRPIGVRLNQLIAFDENYFGFEDQGGAGTFDVGFWANLEYWTSESGGGAQPQPRGRPGRPSRPPRQINFVLVPTRR